MRALDYSLDYLELLDFSAPLDDSAKRVRIAVLANCATQHLVAVIKAIGCRNNICFDIYEGAYSAIELEIIDEKSSLYAFDPQFILIFMTTEKMKKRFYDRSDRADFANASADQLEGLWKTLAGRTSATILQSTFVLPSERAFGNYELKVPDSLGSSIAGLNSQIVERARKAANVLLVDVDFVAASSGRAAWFDPRLWAQAKLPCKLENLPALAQAVTDVVLAASGSITKCVVLDLDNTLWGGVIGDDGLEGIELGEDEGESFVALQKFLRELKRRGILLAVVSKNEPAAALSPFRKHPAMVLKEEDISVFIANWENKADNIRQVRETLNIGFDSLVFLDDNPAERELVRTRLPQVLVPDLPEDPTGYLDVVAALNLFETASFSKEDAKRAESYLQEARRETAKVQYGDIDDFLRALEMTAQIERFSEANLGRIAQLGQRSNQFNLTTRRTSEAAYADMARDANFAPFTIRIADKFGDYGLIGIVVAKEDGDALEIEEFMMSCRVLKRGVEDMAMNEIFAFANRRGLAKVTASYVPTPKNAMVKSFYANFGFEQAAGCENGETRWTLDVNSYRHRKTFIDIDCNEI